jgi:hypothetical protein
MFLCYVIWDNIPQHVWGERHRDPTSTSGWQRHQLSHLLSGPLFSPNFGTREGAIEVHALLCLTSCCACDQYHPSRVSTASYRCPRTFFRCTEGTKLGIHLNGGNVVLENLHVYNTGHYHYRDDFKLMPFGAVWSHYATGVKIIGGYFDDCMVLSASVLGPRLCYCPHVVHVSLEIMPLMSALDSALLVADLGVPIDITGLCTTFLIVIGATF